MKKIIGPEQLEMASSLRRLCLCLLISVLLGGFAVTSAYATGYGAVSENDANSRMFSEQVERGKIRKVIQAPKDDCFVTGYWKANGIDITSKAGGYCNRASIAMALSYLGIDCTPVYMQEIMGGSPDTENNYKKLTEQINIKRGTKISRSTVKSGYSSSILRECYSLFDADSRYSPVYIWGEYNSGKNIHAMLIIGKEGASNGKTRYIILDPSSASHSDHVFWMEINDSTGKATNAGATKYKDYQIKLIIQWKDQFADVVPRIAVTTTKMNLYASAAETSTVKDTASNGDILYLNAKVNDDWYRTEDNLFIRAKDISIKVDKATIEKEEKITATATVTSSDGYLKYKPYEAADHNDGGTATKGTTLNIVSKVENSYGNVWYVTDKGYYIYSGDVSIKADLFNIFAGFYTTEKTTTRKEPYADSAAVSTVSKGKMVVVTKFVTNSYGNIWAQLENGSYICFYDAKEDAIKLDFAHVAQNTTTSGFPTSSSDSGYPGYPTGDRDPKTSCALRGTIKSVVPMLSIEARVTNLSTNKEVLSVTAKPKYDLRSAKINGDITNRDGTKTNINNKMSFSKVADDGYYVYEIVVQHGFVYEGKTFTFGDETVVFDSTFTVGDPEEPLPDMPEPTKKPTGTQIGTGTKNLPGDVNDDGNIDMFDALRLLKYVTGWDVTINEKNANVNGDDSIDMFDALRLLKYVTDWDVELEPDNSDGVVTV